MFSFENVIRLIRDYWQIFLLEGVKYTLLLSVFTVFFGAIFGSILSLGKMSRVAPLRWIVTAYVEVIRGTPMLLQLYIFAFALPKLLPFVDTYSAVQIALICNSAAYISEVIRSGIQSVDIGQTEAARSLGMTKRQTMIHIVLPQAIKNILPALGNEFIMIIKDTSLGSTFFVGEVMTSYLKVKGATYLALESLIIIAVIYFILTFVLSKIFAAVERRLKA